MPNYHPSKEQADEMFRRLMPLFEKWLAMDDAHREDTLLEFDFPNDTVTLIDVDDMIMDEIGNPDSAHRKRFQIHPIEFTLDMEEDDDDFTLDIHQIEDLAHQMCWHINRAKARKARYDNL